MEYTPIGAVTATEHPAAGRAPAYNIPAEIVDGNDVVVMREAVRKAVERARAGGGPTLLECRTYRHYGHSKADPATYRPKAEVEHWLARDPLPRARERLLADGVEEAQIAAVEQDVAARIEQAVAAAKAAPYPDPRDERATEFAA
jgi:acetoin:2,6-dichlorophenolindophenol oxidoreductase subunit alpha